MMTEPARDPILDYARQSEQPERDKGNGHGEAKRPPLPFINMSKWDDEPIPEQDWAVYNRIPRRQCVLFSGEGAAGKSTEQLHLSAAHVLGRDWLGTMPEQGPGLFIDAEDDEKVIHRRLAYIAKHYDVRFDDLIKGGLHLISLFGQDSVLATVSRGGKVEPTPLYQQILEAVGDIKPIMTGFASSANFFAGNELDRGQVQQFISLMTRLAIVADGATVLISHPSLTGITNDSGISGNTQWHNAVRARLYMKGIKPENGGEPDGDLPRSCSRKIIMAPCPKASPYAIKTACFSRCLASARSIRPPKTPRLIRSSSICLTALPLKTGTSATRRAVAMPRRYSSKRTRRRGLDSPEARYSRLPCVGYSRTRRFGTNPMAGRLDRTIASPERRVAHDRNVQRVHTGGEGVCKAYRYRRSTLHPPPWR
jgi:AAA domain